MKEKFDKYVEVMQSIENQTIILENNKRMKDKENAKEDERIISILKNEKNNLTLDILKYISENLKNDNPTKEQLSLMYKSVLDMKNIIEKEYNK